MDWNAHETGQYTLYSTSGRGSDIARDRNNTSKRVKRRPGGVGRALGETDPWGDGSVSGLIGLLKCPT